MKSFKRTLTLTALISLLPLTALAELTPYQQGVYDGLKAGITIGQVLGAAPYDATKQQQYNQMVDNFNQGLGTIFEGNQTAIGMFWLKPFSGTSAAGSTNTLNPYKSLSKVNKPVHSVDGSWNQSNTMVPAENPNLRYGDMPLSSVYTWMGSTTRDSNGNIVENPAVPRAYTGANEAMGWI